MKKILSFLVVIVLTITLVACAKEQEFDFDRGYIVVGLEADYEPFNWLETTANDYNMPLEGQKDGFVAGYDVEVAKFIGEQLDLEVRFKQIEWSSLIPALRSGEIDLIIAGMSPTENRKRTIQFSNYYYMSNHVVVLESDNEYANATSLDDLNGAKGIGQAGTTYEEIIKFLGENHGVNVISSRDDIPQIVQAITGGVADFTVVERPVAESIVKINSNFKIILESSEENNIYEVSAEDRELSIGLRKIDARLTQLVNDALNEATQEMRDTWMSEALERQD